MATKHKRHLLCKIPANVLNVKFSDAIWDTVYDEYLIQNPKIANYNIRLTMNYMLASSICEELKKYGIDDAKYCRMCDTIKREQDFYTPYFSLCKDCMRHTNRNVFGGFWADAVESTNAKCAVCGDYFEHVHHVIPKSCGGKDEFNNLIPLCKSCHYKAHRKSSKSDKYRVNKNMLSEFISLGYASDNKDIINQLQCEDICQDQQ